MDNEIGKKDIRITFHTYDFLGYFLPGAVFLSIIYVFKKLIEEFYKGPFPPFHYLISSFKSYFSGSNSHWASEVVLLVLFIIFCYSLGHLIASLSAFFLDRLLVGKCFKYPYVILFKLNGKSSNHKLKRILFFSVFVSNILFLVNLFLLQKQLFFISLAVIVLLGIISLSYINKIHVEEESGQNNKDNFLISFIIRIFDTKLIKKLGVIENVLKYSLNIYSTFDHNFINKFKVAYEEVFDSDLEQDKVLVYWNCRNYIYQKGGALNEMLINWFNLYSYSRNLASCVYLSFICILMIIFYQAFIIGDKDLITKFSIYSSNILSFKLFLSSLIIFSVLFVLRYYYLYYTYYNKYLYRTFLYLYQQEKKNRSL
ncbi:MAG: hypothetical protein KatS3mg036_0133 [Ignavibacterium sp.]|nr:MAG: hypothetical protein KatS3mg036_0133 [Ignavibacterium sp.]